jgi:hypothetical protein
MDTGAGRVLLAGFAQHHQGVPDANITVVDADSTTDLSCKNGIAHDGADEKEPTHNRWAWTASRRSVSLTRPAQTWTISRSTTTYLQRANAAAIGALSTSVAATISVAPPSTSRWLASSSSSSA